MHNYYCFVVKLIFVIKMLLIVVIILLIFAIVIISFKIYDLIYNDCKHDTNNYCIDNKNDYCTNNRCYNLFGGDAEQLKDNKGISSYCEIDGNKFIKYYFESKNETIYNKDIISVIKGKKITSKYLYEKDIMQLIEEKHIPNINIPKLYVDESYDIEFNEEIYKKIVKSVFYKSDDIQMKKITIEYLPFKNLIDYLNEYHNIDEIKQTEENREILIKIFSNYFKTIYQFIKNDILPYDIENGTNILINSENCTLYNINMPLFRVITNKYENITHKDIFIYFVYNVISCSPAKDIKNVFYYLYNYQNVYKDIIQESLKDILTDEEIKIFLHDFQFMKTKERIIKGLLKHNSFLTSDILTILNLYLFHNDDYKKVKQTCKRIIEQIKDTNGRNIIMKNIKYPPFFRLVLEHLINNNINISYNKLAYIYFLSKRYNENELLQNIKIIIENENNADKTLYYLNNYPLIGYENINDLRETNKDNIKQTKTNNYLKLIPFYANCSYYAKYIGFTYQNEKYINDGFEISYAEIIPTKYFIYDNVK